MNKPVCAFTTEVQIVYYKCETCLDNMPLATE